MKHISLTTLIVLFLLLLSKNGFCQDDNVVTDKTDTIEDIIIDTSLYQTKFNEVNDSLTAYKSSKDFAYMRYMDSLLRKRSDLTVDTISGDALKNGSFKKEKLSNQPSPKKRTLSLSFLNSPVVKIIFWTLAIGFICFILYKLFLTGGVFKRPGTQENTPVEEQQEEALEPSAYDELIRRAVANKNLRLAVRYWYLQTLQRLSASGAIRFSADKTNYEYVRETAGKNYQKEFASLTTNYEYVWYGKFDVSDDVYERLQKDFRFFHQKI